MQFPEMVKIGCIRYKVSVTDETLLVDHRECKGKIDYNQGTIELSGSKFQGDESRYETFWHEVMHGFMSDRDIELEDEEAIVTALGKAMAAFCIDNQLVFQDG